MAAAAKQATGPTLPDWRSLAQPAAVVEVAQPVGDLIGGKDAGHNLVIDRRQPGALALYIATDEEAMAQIMQAKASAEKLKADPKAVGARYLSRTVRPPYNAIPLDIGGKRFYLKLTLEEDRAKK